MTHFAIAHNRIRALVRYAFVGRPYLSHAPRTGVGQRIHGGRSMVHFGTSRDVEAESQARLARCVAVLERVEQNADATRIRSVLDRIPDEVGYP